MNKIKLSAALIAINNAQNEVQQEFPSQFSCVPEEDCLDYTGIEWKAASIEDELAEDLSYPIFDTEEVVEEEVLEELDAEGNTLQEAGIVRSCPEDFQLFEEIQEDESILYACKKILGYEIRPTGRKTLVNDPIKLANLEAIQVVEQEAQAARALLEAKAAKGKADREICLKVLDLIAGFNLDRDLTIEDITALQTLLGQPEAVLRAGRPGLAAILIDAVVPDNNLVTQEMKDASIMLLQEHLTKTRA